MTPLHLAAYNNNSACVEILLERGGDIKATNCDSRRPVHEVVIKK